MVPCASACSASATGWRTVHKRAALHLALGTTLYVLVFTRPVARHPPGRREFLKPKPGREKQGEGKSNDHFFDHRQSDSGRAGPMKQSAFRRIWGSCHALHGLGLGALKFKHMIAYYCPMRIQENQKFRLFSVEV